MMAKAAVLDDDSALLPYVLDRLTDICSLGRSSRVCRGWCVASATCWTTMHARVFGEHSNRWGGRLEPAPGDRTRVRLRLEAARARTAGLCHERLLLFRPGRTPASSEFFVSSIALDGSFLAIGEYSGVTSLWDLRTGRQLWRVTGGAGQSEGHGVSDLHLDGVAGLLATATTTMTLDENASSFGVARVLRLSDGICLMEVPHTEAELRTLAAECGVTLCAAMGSLARVHVYTDARCVKWRRCEAYRVETAVRR